MFLRNSRYTRVEQKETKTKDGRTVKIVALRHLPSLAGTATVVMEHDRLDVMAKRKYSDSTMFWRIADANTELEANDLVYETGRTIKVPEQ